MIRVREAQLLLANLVDEDPFDFVFIDANKSSYNDYIVWGIHNTRQGGVIAAPNTFHGFSSSGGFKNDQISQAILTLNRKISSDPRLNRTIFPAGDSILVAVKEFYEID